MVTTKSFLIFLTNGKFWFLKCLLATIVATLVFSCYSIAVFFKFELPAAYELKSRHPFAVTSGLAADSGPGEHEHGANLSPRVVGGLALYVARRLHLHPFVPAVIGGILFLASGIWGGTRITGDRSIGFSLGLTLAGLFASAACFTVTLPPKPFDGVALGLIALAIISIRRPLICSVSAFLAFWTDERAIISIIGVGLLIWSIPGLTRSERKVRLAALAGTLLMYVTSRLLMGHIFGWPAIPSYIATSEVLKGTAKFLPLAGWMCFKGSWPIILFAAWILYSNGERLFGLLFAGACAVAWGTCILVTDVSRSSSFAFPWIFASLAILASRGVTTERLRLLAFSAAAITLLCPNVQLSAGAFLLPSVPALLIWFFTD